MKYLLTVVIIVLLIPFTSQAQHKWMSPPDNPIELGNVRWYRNYDEAIRQSKNEDKPVFLLFQEVPGCSTCTSYGKEILSHPLLVEAIEENFIPLCIYNNIKGHDAAILKKFKEPSWNNPVVRIISHKGTDVVPRLASRYAIGYVVSGMIDAMTSLGRPTPEYLRIMEQEYANPQKKELVLSMYCFWTGEKVMATIPGVTESEAGFMNGNEVVKVTYDPDILSTEDLIQAAKKGNCADAIFSNNIRTNTTKVEPTGSFRRDKESKYYLYHTPYRSLPMTHLQQLLANAELARDGDISYLLSDRQLELKKMIDKKSIGYNSIGEDIMSSWQKVIDKLNP